MKKEGMLQLELRDVYGKYLKEKVDVILRNQVRTHNAKASPTASKKITIKGLYGNPQGLYRIEIDPPSYLPVSRFVNLHAGKATPIQITFPIDSSKIKKVNFRKFDEFSEGFRTLLEKSANVFNFPGKIGKGLFNALDNIRRAGLLNIAAKTQATRLSNDKKVFEYIQEIYELRGDRFFALVEKELREETKNSVAEGLFHEVKDTLHHLPGKFTGFSRAGSFKTEDAYGNLQLTFFMKGDKCVADIDIDDAAGLGHVFQVLRNALSGRSTNPYDIHEILVSHQGLDLGYTFQV